MTLPTVRDLTHVRPSPGAHRIASRAAVSVLIPLVAVWAMGHPEWALYAAFGSFTALYGRHDAHLTRAQMQAAAGLLLVAATVTGTFLGTFEARHWLIVLAGPIIAATGSIIGDALRFHPPGPLFLVFAVGATANGPRTPADIPVALVVSAAAAALSVIIGSAGYLHRPTDWNLLRLKWRLTWQPLRYAVATLVAGAVTTGIGLGHAYWAMVAAVAPLAAPGISSQLTRAIQRVAGTMAGLIPAAPLLALRPTGLLRIGIIVVLQAATELLIGRNYGLGMLAMTPMALVMSHSPTDGHWTATIIDRGVATALGAFLGVALVGLTEMLRRRRARRTAPID